MNVATPEHLPRDFALLAFLSAKLQARQALAKIYHSSLLILHAQDKGTMEENMSATQLPLTLIVAATVKNGIGKDGALPWPMLKKEMAYFARVTKRVPLPTNTGSLQSDALRQVNLEGTRRNVVIMGRKTWDSIPPKFRPLKDRTSIVISSQTREKLDAVPDDVVVAGDILSGLRELDGFVKDERAPPVARAFVIGGTSVYRAALELEQTKRILLTRIREDYECDTFFPIELDREGEERDGWRRQTLKELREFTGEDGLDGSVTEKAGDGEVQFEYQLYERP